MIFPAFRKVVPAAELADLGQHFADLERQQFGRDEFGAMVARVARIEQNLDGGGELVGAAVGAVLG